MLVLVMPDFLAGARIQRIDVVERGGDVHHAIDDDRRGFQRFLHIGLEDPGRAAAARRWSVLICCVRIEARLRSNCRWYAGSCCRRCRRGSADPASPCVMSPYFTAALTSCEEAVPTVATTTARASAPAIRESMPLRAIMFPPRPDLRSILFMIYAPASESCIGIQDLSRK